MNTAQELYSQSVLKLPASEQLRLATFILEGLTASGALDYSDSWTDEDISDLTAASMSHAMNYLDED